MAGRSLIRGARGATAVSAGSASSDLATMSAQDMAARIKRSEISPLEIVGAVLDRIERLEPSLNAFAALDRDGALAAAAAAERAVMRGEPLGPLHGVPVTIKDVQAVRGLPTRRGSRSTDPGPVPADAPAVARLRNAGAIILGKTTMTEHGWTAVSDSPLTGATHNPWRHGLTSGGSSSGAAALAAAGCGPLHLGTDGAGSVRLPAHFCGVLGFKPTYGTVPYVPVPNNGSLSHIGPITRDVGDAELMLSVMSGFHPSDPTTGAARFAPSRQSTDRRSLRIAYSPDLGHARVDPDVARLVADAVETLGDLGFPVEPATPPWGRAGPDLIRSLWGAPLLALVPTTAEGWSALDPGLAACLRDAASLTLADVTAAQGRRLAYSTAVGAWFAEGWDLLVTPSASVAAFPVGSQRPPHWPEHAWDWLSWAEFSYPFNLSHGPAVSVPCGLDPEGRPVGFQIAGPRYSDALVLEVAKAFLAVRPCTVPEMVDVGL
ncbi:amidase [Methylobacterium currus]|uniref:amidase family protein n=1 Tax=Methylobacterium currus TaxID=2051553 RepID=UPI001E4345C0|nr:amidase family protein [Methylobacterium currus]UHC17877.1 amidase [Methylobacterium currus]